jgi:hypothetical protein
MSRKRAAGGEIKICPRQQCLHYNGAKERMRRRRREEEEKDEEDEARTKQV